MGESLESLFANLSTITTRKAYDRSLFFSITFMKPKEKKGMRSWERCRSGVFFFLFFWNLVFRVDPQSIPLTTVFDSASRGIDPIPPPPPLPHSLLLLPSSHLLAAAIVASKTQIFPTRATFAHRGVAIPETNYRCCNHVPGDLFFFCFFRFLRKLGSTMLLCA